MANRQLVILNLNEEDFGVEITQVDSIIKMQEIYKVPNTPPFIEGLINLRGKVYTVFCLRKKFGMPDKPFDGNTKIVIVNVNSIMVGFIVDEVKEILTFEEADVEPAPDFIKELDRKYLTGVAKKGDKIVLILDLKQVLSLDEQKQANDLNSKEKGRK
jgi:purine-binding chemotaxis protein CheW